MLQPAPRSLTIQFNNAGKVPESFMYTKHFSFIAELIFFFSLETLFFGYYFQTKKSNVIKLPMILLEPRQQ